MLAIVRASRPAVLAGILAALLAADSPSNLKPKPTPAPGPWTVTHRAIGEGRGLGRFWKVDYVLRNDGTTAREVRPEAFSAVVSGSVSNSRVPGHARPRASRVEVSGSSGLSSSCDVIPSEDEARRCRERVVLQAWPADLGAEPPDPIAKAAVRLVALSEQPAIAIAPGASLRVRLRLEHDHFLYGPHDSLLGTREVVLKLGADTVKDTLALDREIQLPKKASGEWAGLHEPPADRLDACLFVSAPNSLHIEAHIPGNQSYRFKECPIRYSTRMRLRFWYLIAAGTEGDGKVMVVQYKDAPTAWKILSDGDLTLPLTTVGRWVKVEKTFRTESEATSLTLEFRLPGDIGEMTIDDLTLEPAEDDAGGP